MTLEQTTLGIIDKPSSSMHLLFKIHRKTAKMRGLHPPGIYAA